MYTVSPYDGEGVTILEDGQCKGRLHVDNDTVQGLMQIVWTPENMSPETETVHYDPLTGVVTE